MFESCFLIANFRDLFLVYAGLYIRYMSVVPPFTWAKYFDPTLPTATIQPTTIRWHILEKRSRQEMKSHQIMQQIFSARWTLPCSFCWWLSAWVLQFFIIRFELNSAYQLEVALEHSQVLAIFCSMVFTSDHLCIQSVKCTHCTWVVWNENCATRNREYSRVLECHH